MNITQITVSYGETQSLPEYSNVKPSITLTATLEDGELHEDVEAELWAHAKYQVHAQIDLALEANDRPAKYDPAPRYQVMRTYNDPYGPRAGALKVPIVVVVLPDDTDPKDRFGVPFVHAGYANSSNLRYDHAMRLARKAAIENTADLIDCADGNLDRLKETLAVAERNPEPDPTF
jgi:hypothetical protein